ncbi:hypothetical protein LNP74_13830 [Klebsiella pneumoniae subsp. pneumoniae]|nr:hypothetical protein [Klebsiella pneumoniae subsp. pneumoniae]
MKAQVADCLNATNKRASELTIACFGPAFKPNIDDLRESPAMEIAAQIARWHSGTTQVVGAQHPRAAEETRWTVYAGDP